VPATAPDVEAILEEICAIASHRLFDERSKALVEDLLEQIAAPRGFQLWQAWDRGALPDPELGPISAALVDSHDELPLDTVIDIVDRWQERQPSTARAPCAPGMLAVASDFVTALFRRSERWRSAVESLPLGWRVLLHLVDPTTPSSDATRALYLAAMPEFVADPLSHLVDTWHHVQALRIEPARFAEAVDPTLRALKQIPGPAAMPWWVVRSPEELIALAPHLHRAPGYAGERLIQLRADPLEIALEIALAIGARGVALPFLARIGDRAPSEDHVKLLRADYTGSRDKERWLDKAPMVARRAVLDTREPMAEAELAERAVLLEDPALLERAATAFAVKARAGEASVSHDLERLARARHAILPILGPIYDGLLAELASPVLEAARAAIAIRSLAIRAMELTPRAIEERDHRYLCFEKSVFGALPPDEREAARKAQYAARQRLDPRLGGTPLRPSGASMRIAATWTERTDEPPPPKPPPTRRRRIVSGG
jgi:hypothetical protein